MARSAKLSTTTIKGIVYWCTQSGGKRTYFGRKDEMSRKQAETAFADHLNRIRTETAQQKDQRVSRAISVWELCDRHNLWLLANREKPTYSQRRWALSLFCNHKIEGKLFGKGQALGDLPYDHLTLQHGKEFVASADDPKTALHLTIAIKAALNWAARSTEADGGGLVPDSFQPFRHLRRPFVPPKDLTEADLITDAEHQLLVKYSAERYHDWPPCDEATRDLLILMHNTGPRTSEPLLCTVRDFSRRTRQLTLGSHKRSRTQSNTTLRQLVLNDESFAIVAKHCRDKGPNDPIFTKANGSRFTQEQLNERLRQVREVIKKKNEKDKRIGIVRAGVTPYSYRDLYISELLMAGVPIFQVAKMAGTSIKMIEKTYGHFFVADLANAQAKLDADRKNRQNKVKVIKIAS